jgi:error-prone DNA polymerase
MPGYAELQVTSNFSFLEGASHPHELVETAAALGHAAIAIVDRNTLAGVVRAHLAARQAKLRLVIGCRLDFRDRPSLLCFPTDKPAYSRLSQLLTLGKRRAPKGECHLDAADLAAWSEGQILAILPPDRPDDDFVSWVARDAAAFGDRYFVASQHRYRGDDAERIAWLAGVAARAGARLLATNDVLYHAPERRALQDVVSCIRLKCTIETAGRRLEAHAERHLKTPAEMARLFRRWPDAIAATGDVVRRCTFELKELRYEYPDEVPEGRSPQEELEVRVARAVAARCGGDPPARLADQIRHELKLIAERDYAPFFLTVHDIVEFAKSRNILCQGRGSAANSAVCWGLGITAVDPGKFDLLFERFISTARDEPPDIDVDFAHEQREIVIQHIYQHYTRERCGIAATVICYRMRSAVREVGKVMGLSVDAVSSLSATIWGWSKESLKHAHVREAGMDPSEKLLARTLELAGELVGFPRHLSQHVGGFVITRGPLADLVPICNAAMADRTNIEWDKDDLDAVGMLKVDILGLGMLTCIDKAFKLVERHHGRMLELYAIPRDDPAVYEMACRADTVGVFQIESRAQMSMLPRLKPDKFYDLVIEVAIVRPGPIQGDMVHPYLRRKRGEEQVDYPSDALRKVLEKTLGVPLFQEQAMRIAIVGAGFTPDEADGLRRAMATFKHTGTIHKFRERFIAGMLGNGYTLDFANRCFGQIEGFGTYGFPESHAVSFALLAYVSAWLKRHYPEAFAAALLNSQPMGFYQPAQIVRDAREHGVKVRPVDVNHSAWDCTLEATVNPRPALRLGLREIIGLAEAEAKKLVDNRGAGYASPADLARRARLSPATLARLAAADAFGSMGLDRRAALWAVKPLGEAPLPLFEHAAPAAEPAVSLPLMRRGEHVTEDYGTVGLSLKRHPVAFLRPRLERRGIMPCAALAGIRDGRRVEIAGLVLVRQRPGTASGVIFMTLEDETGIANAVIWSSVFEQFRRIVMTGRMIAVRGLVQKDGRVIHVVAEQLTDLSADLGRLDPPLSRADEVLHPGRDQRSLRQVSRDFH